MERIKELYEDFAIRNTKYNGTEFILIRAGKSFKGNSLQEVIDKIIKEEDFFNNITTQEVEY
jgi:hypothetical protein